MHFSRDIALIMEQKKELKFDSMYFVGISSLAEYYSNIFQILKQLNCNWSSELFYIGIKETKWRSQNQRKHISAEAVLNIAKTDVIKELKADITLELGEKLDDVAECLSVSGVILHILSHDRNKEAFFDFEECLQFSENSAIACQFLHAGLLKIEEYADFKYNFDTDLSPLGEPEAVHLIQHLARFDEIISKSYSYSAPHYIVRYVSILCQLTNAAINVLRLDIKEDRLRVIKARLLLFHATQKILHQCLKLLGVQPLENQ